MSSWFDFDGWADDAASFDPYTPLDLLHDVEEDASDLLGQKIPELPQLIKPIDPAAIAKSTAEGLIVPVGVAVVSAGTVYLAHRAGLFKAAAKALGI
jgi:hypothetical protein